MALFTRNDRVATDQRELRQIVIEVGHFAPARVLVTLLATCAELAFVRIILLVTRDASGLEFLLERSGVTHVAFDLYVFAPQRIFRLVMIEM